MNGSQLDNVAIDGKGDLTFDEMIASPLLANEIDAVLAGVDALLADNAVTSCCSITRAIGRWAK